MRLQNPIASFAISIFLSIFLAFPSSILCSSHNSISDQHHTYQNGGQQKSPSSSLPTHSSTPIPTRKPPPPNYPPHVPGAFGPFNPLSPVPGWQPLIINETTNYYEYHAHGDEKGKYVRSMCPAVNTLANRGYLPRTGKGVTYFDLVRKMKEVFNFGEDNGLVVVEPVFALHGYPDSIDLDMFGDDLVQHAINCPAAPTREDRDIGDNIRMNRKYFKQLLQSSSDGQTFSPEDFARHHHLRHNQSVANNPKFRFGNIDAICSLAQYANLLAILGRNGKHGFQTVYLDDLKYFYEKEDFPPSWKRREWGYYLVEAGSYVDRMSNYIGFQVQRPFPPSDFVPGVDVEPLVAQFDKPCPFQRGYGRNGKREYGEKDEIKKDTEESEQSLEDYITGRELK